MPSYNIDTAAAVAYLERSGFTSEQARSLATIVAEVDAQHVTKADLRLLDQQLETGFARVETRIAEAANQVHVRSTAVTLGGIAVAKAVLVAVLA